MDHHEDRELGKLHQNTTHKRWDFILADEDKITIALDMLPPNVPFIYIADVRTKQCFEDLRTRIEDDVEYHVGGARKLELCNQAINIEQAHRHRCAMVLPSEQACADANVAEATEFAIVMNLDGPEFSPGLFAFIGAEYGFMQRYPKRPTGPLARSDSQPARDPAPRDARGVRCLSCGGNRDTPRPRVVTGCG